MRTIVVAGPESTPALKQSGLGPVVFAAFLRGWEIFRDTGVSVSKCPLCNGLIVFARVKPETIAATCPCRKTRGTFPESMTDSVKARLLIALAQKNC